MTYWLGLRVTKTKEMNEVDLKIKIWSDWMEMPIQGAECFKVRLHFDACTPDRLTRARENRSVWASWFWSDVWLFSVTPASINNYTAIANLGCFSVNIWYTFFEKAAGKWKEIQKMVIFSISIMLKVILIWENTSTSEAWSWTTAGNLCDSQAEMNLRGKVLK